MIKIVKINMNKIIITFMKIKIKSKSLYFIKINYILISSIIAKEIYNFLNPKQITKSHSHQKYSLTKHIQLIFNLNNKFNSKSTQPVLISNLTLPTIKSLTL